MGSITRSRRSMLLAITILMVCSMAMGALSLRDPAALAAPFSLKPLAHSAAPWTTYARLLGHHNTNDQITIGMLLRTSQPAQQQALLKSLYNPRSSNYHHWLSTGEFTRRFAPSTATITAARSYLIRQGLQLVASPDQTLIMAQGTTRQIEAAFHTSLNDYHLKDGSNHFGNSTDIQLPANLLDATVGVFGLNSLNAFRPDNKIEGKNKGKKGATSPPPAYGAGPHGSGLIPSQITGIYSANAVYTKLHDTGQGTTLAVYELAGYKASDITKYENQFHLNHVTLINKAVLEGTRNHNGAAEVELDIELQIAMAPGIKKLEVYQAPNTELGGLAEYLQMAKDNSADAISSSWGVACELVLNSQVTLAENQIFLQMAAQGQSLFIASGDAGAFGCAALGISLSMPDGLQLADANDQPYDTAVGGTSFKSPLNGILFDPGKNTRPKYPGSAKEITWIRKPCSAESCDGGGSGGGVSRIWAEPDYAFDANGFPLPGIIENNFSQGGSYCNQMPYVLCRENPDVSLDADPSTGYAIYCTDPGDSFCATGEFTPQPGWIRLGGTSCSAPLWAGIAALYIQHHEERQGLFNYLVYPLDSSSGYKNQLHDITIDDNGYYAAGPGYDMATGLGTPNIYKLIK